MTDDLGLIADAAITNHGVQAKAIERIAFRMPDDPDRHELVWIVERLRDDEARLRGRIAVLARVTSQ